MSVIVGSGNAGTEWKSDKAGMPTRTSDPGSAYVGDSYWKTDTNKLRVYNGSSWVDV